MDCVGWGRGGVWRGGVGVVWCGVGLGSMGWGGVEPGRVGLGWRAVGEGACGRRRGGGQQAPVGRSVEG